MKAQTERALAEFNAAYARVFTESRHSQSDEALSLGVDISTAHNYLRCDSDRHLPAGLIPASLFAHEILAYLASQCGGTYIELTGKLNGSINDEVAGMLKAIGDIVRTEDSLTKTKLLRRVATLATKALEETR